MNFFNSIINHFNDFLKKRTTLLNLLVRFFDLGSKFTHFFLFNVNGYAALFLLMFIIPVYYSEQYLNFLNVLIKDTSNLSFCFKNLPFLLQVLFCFYLFILELIFFCSFLASIPVIEQKMIENYNDSLILEKRGYNALPTKAQKITTLSVTLAVAIIVLGINTISQ
jgi:hypothetical protein